jgi:hypothetical protein
MRPGRSAVARGARAKRKRPGNRRSFTAQTSAANLTGMGRVMSFKNSMMLTAPRIFGLITLLAPDAVQTAWEAEGIAFWPTLSAIPDFSDTVRRVVIMSVGSRRKRTRRR